MVGDGKTNEQYQTNIHPPLAGDKKLFGVFPWACLEVHGVECEIYNTTSTALRQKPAFTSTWLSVNPAN